MDTKIDQLKQIIPEKYILRQEPMKNHTTFRSEFNQIGMYDQIHDLS